MNKILKSSIICASILIYSSFSLGEIKITNAQYPIPEKRSINWVGNYNPKDINDYWNYKIFLSKKYNASNNSAEKRNIVKEQNRAKNYSRAKFERSKKIKSKN